MAKKTEDTTATFAFVKGQMLITALIDMEKFGISGRKTVRIPIQVFDKDSNRLVGVATYDSPNGMAVEVKLKKLG